MLSLLLLLVKNMEKCQKTEILFWQQVKIVLYSLDAQSEIQILTLIYVCEYVWELHRPEHMGLVQAMRQ